MPKESIEIAEVFERFWPYYEAQNRGRLLPVHYKAVAAIRACMTGELGGHKYRCKDCDESFWAHHGCRNRACPKCHGRQTVEWVQKRSVELLPCPYFHVIATVPAEMRPYFLFNQEDLYSILMRSAAHALIELSKEKRFIGAEPGILSVLHTWTGTMQYHPHVHMLVTGGGLDADGQTWRPTSPSFLVPVKRLSPLIAERFREELRKVRPDLIEQIPSKIWTKEWCSYADAKAAGKGQDAVLNYLARYVFRIAITRSRIVHMDETHVTFRYKENSTGIWKMERVTGNEFIRRFLLHVLPKGLHKVRYFGLWAPGNKARLRTLALELALLQKERTTPTTLADLAEEALEKSDLDNHGYIPKCPQCGSTDLLHIEQRRRHWRRYVI